MRENRKPIIRRTLVFGAPAVLVVALGAVGGVSFASSPRNVPCSVPSAHYPTIQSAVDAPACSVVRVAPGSFTENVSVNRSVTLTGARAGQDARFRRGDQGRGTQGHGDQESVVNGGAGATFTITANNVTVDGFTLNGPPGGGTAALVMQAGNSGETVQNNVINNPGRAASITTSRTTFRSNAVKNTATASDGFQANSTALRDLTIADNNFSGANPATYNADVTVIEGNANVNVTGNRSTGDGTLIALFKTAGARIADNTVVGGGGSSAVYLGGGNSRVTVSGNTVTSAGSAVKVDNSFGVGANSGIAISRNELRRNEYGVRVGANSTTDAVQVSRNTLTGNTLFGVFTDPAAGAQTTATCNWWGAISGPGPVGPGRGDKVSTNVTYRPWLTLPALSRICR